MKKLPLYIFLVLLMISACSGQCIKGDCTNGYGTYTHPNGDKYVGEFKDGIAHGQGTATWASGDKYIGGWKDGEYHGQGTLILPDGRVLKGRWKSNSLVK